MFDHPDFLSQGWSRPLRRSCASPSPCLWSAWRAWAWPSWCRRACLHLPWPTSSSLYLLSSWWWDIRTHINEFGCHNTQDLFTASLILILEGVCRLPCQSQFHAELALLGEMDQHLQIWTQCKAQQPYLAVCVCVRVCVLVRVFQHSLSLSISLQAVFINELSGQVFQSDTTTWVLNNHQTLLFTNNNPHCLWLCAISLQSPRGATPGNTGHRLLCVGLLAEPGGSAGNHVGLHGLVLRPAATNQPLEMMPLRQQMHFAASSN